MPKFSDYGWWLLPLIAVAVMVVIFFASLGSFQPVWLSLSQRVRESEKRRIITSYIIQTPRGEIAVTEYRSGTEFNRILQMPGGQAVAEAGWVNQWGEEQIRMIGQAQENR